jgi:O-antigen/teichoic acid export membrane protein
VIIARCLGPKEYGGFIAVAAMASMISPFVGIGTGSLLVKNVSREPGLFAECWGNCLAATAASGIALDVLTILLASAFLPKHITLLAIALICTADMVLVRFLDMAVWAFQAFERLSVNAHLNVLISFLRLIGVIVLALWVRHPTVLAWSVVYFGASLGSSIAAIVWVTASLGKPTLNLRRLASEWSEGSYFAVSTAAATIYNDIDKTMVARLSTLEATGIYGAAYRLIDVAFIPIRALLNAAYPRFFRSGAKSWRSAFGYGRQLFQTTWPYALLVSIGLAIGAPVVPKILGPAYANVTEALRWLSPLPLLKTFQFFIADSLTGAGYQRRRTIAQVSVAVFNVLINLWAIPLYGWRGAAWTSLLSDGLLALVLWLTAYQLVCTLPVEKPAEAFATMSVDQDFV